MLYKLNAVLHFLNVTTGGQWTFMILNILYQASTPAAYLSWSTRDLLREFRTDTLCKPIRYMHVHIAITLLWHELFNSPIYLAIVRWNYCSTSPYLDHKNSCENCDNGPSSCPATVPSTSLSALINKPRDTAAESVLVCLLVR